MRLVDINYKYSNLFVCPPLVRAVQHLGYIHGVVAQSTLIRAIAKSHNLVEYNHALHGAGGSSYRPQLMGFDSLPHFPIDQWQTAYRICKFI